MKKINSKIGLLTLTMAYVTLVGGCAESQPTDEQGSSDTLMQETVQVGTDLSIAAMQKVSAAYSDETGIIIEWVAITEQDIKDTMQIDDVANIEPNVNSEPKLAEGLDMLLMHSAYILNVLGQTHQLQPIASQVLMASTPEQYQDPNGEWYGITKYARTLVYNHNKVNEPELINYASLAADKWYGRLCITDIDTPENQAIFKVMVPYRGQKRTLEVINGWLNNISRVAPDNETVLSLIEQGQCDVGVVDSDVFWHYAKTHPNTQVRLMWANQINRGVMTDAISAGINASSDDAGQALEFMEWLVSDEGQALFAFHTSTFPLVNIKDESIDMQAIRPEWTKFEADPTPLFEVMAIKGKVESEPAEDTLSN